MRIKKLYTSTAAAFGCRLVLHTFEHFATSQASYSRLVRHYQLPSIKTLICVTSKDSNISEKHVFGSLFSNIKDSQKVCILLNDEMIRNALKFPKIPAAVGIFCYYVMFHAVQEIPGKNILLRVSVLIFHIDKII